MTVAVTLAGGNKLVTLMCCTDDVILGIGIGIGYWYRCRPIVLGIGYASWYRSNPSKNMPHWFVRVIELFLHDRRFRVHIGDDTSAWRTQVNGLP